MKELILRFLGAVALAITLVSDGQRLALRPACARRRRPLPFDRIYQQSLLSMQNRARRVGLTIDTDIDMQVGASSHVLRPRSMALKTFAPIRTGRMNSTMVLSTWQDSNRSPTAITGCTTLSILEPRRTPSFF